MRMTPRTALVLAAIVALSACNRAEQPAAAETPAPAAEAAAPTEAPASAQAGLAIEGEGLRLFDASGAARALPFGTPQATVIQAVTTATGGIAPEQNTNEECGAGPTQFAQYPDGFLLLFQDEKFAGWFLREPGLTTVNGIGVGSTRAALNEAFTIEMVPDSTLGVEFTAGELGGFLTADGAAGTVESLNAGLTCFFG